MEDIYDKLFKYCFIGCTNNVLELLSLHNDKIDINWANTYGYTLLILSCIRDYTDIITSLLKYSNIDVNFTTNSGWTALMFVCLYGNKDIIELLINHPNIDINYTNKDGHNAFYMLCNSGKNIDIIEKLITMSVSYDKFE